MADTKLPKCENTHCQGHLGKFSDCVAEALYAMDADASTGSVEFHGHLSLHHILSDFTYVSQEASLTVTIPIGTYLVVADDQGFVSATRYPALSTEAQTIYDTYDNQYGAWMEND